ncbi:MAG: hypothetical protein AAFV87_02170 [Pseudomonadota bacterium]
MTRVLSLIGVAVIGFILFYASRFWYLSLWGRPGLFGSEALPPQGGLLGRWLRGTDAAPFELIIWAVAAFLILSAVQWASKMISGRD